MLVFDLGPFGIHVSANYKQALIAFAKALFPEHTCELMAARVCLNGDMSIERMFECPYIDKRWIFEYYGSLLVDPMHERSLFRILSNEELMKKLIDHIENSSESLDWINILSDLIEKLGQDSLEPRQVPQLKSMIEKLRRLPSSVS